MELEKASTDNESKKKKAQTDVKAIEEKLGKQESLVWPQNNLIIQVSGRKQKQKKNSSRHSNLNFYSPSSSSVNSHSFVMLFIDKAIRSG